MTTKIFISYSRRDNTFAHRLAEDLRAAGYTVWLDVSTLRAGQDWADEIDRAVRACEALILVVSPDSMASEWVSKETILAMNLKKSIVPVMCRQADLPVHLIDIQYIDFQGRYNEAQQQLLQALSSLRATGMPPTSPPPRRSPPKRKWTTWLIVGSLLCCVLLAVLATAGTIGWQMFATPTTIVKKPTHTPTPGEPTAVPTSTNTATPTDDLSSDTINPDLTETDIPTPPPTPTDTATPEPTDTPFPTPNPALGTFQTEFIETTDIAYLAFGPTLGGQAICNFHNITLTQQDVGKELSAFIRDFVINAPDNYTDLIDINLYRSQVGPWQAEQSINMWETQQAELVTESQETYELRWTVTQPGNYVVCLQSPMNTYYDSNVSFDFASFSVLLSGG